MADRENLIELIGATPYGNNTVGKNFQEGFIAKIADNLIANGVTIPVRCCDCKYGIWDDEEAIWQCVYSAEFNDETGIWFGFVDYNNGDHFCSYGERRTE
jgi:hypothetical protein